MSYNKSQRNVQNREFIAICGVFYTTVLCQNFWLPLISLMLKNGFIETIKTLKKKVFSFILSYSLDCCFR